MGVSRKFKRRHKVKKEKATRKVIKQAVNRMNSLGDKCASCGVKFDREAENWTEWMVYVMGNKPNLICPDCCKLIQKQVGEIKEEESVKIN